MIKKYIIEQTEKHASMCAQDVVKMCYQAAFGAEHMISNDDAVRTYFYSEYDQLTADVGEELLEEISPQVCRVNMRAWKATQMEPQRLLDAFVMSASVNNNGKETFREYLLQAEHLVENELIPISKQDWYCFMQKYKNDGMPAVHHSEAYRQNERPAYRIVKKQFIESMLQ